MTAKPLMIWMAALSAGCVAAEPGTSQPHVPELQGGPTAGVSAPAPVQTGPQPELPPPPRLSIELVPLQLGALPEAGSFESAFTAPAAGAAIDPAKLREQPVALRLPKDTDATFWLQLDSLPPRAVKEVQRLGDLFDAWTLLAEGEHTLRLFATESEGALLLGPGQTPILVQQRLQIGSAQRVWSGSAAALIAPHGTANGSAAAAAQRLQFWHEDIKQPQRVVIRGPGGAVAERELLPGAYQLAGLVSGDYTFELPEFGLRSVLTVNAELNPEEKSD